MVNVFLVRHGHTHDIGRRVSGRRNSVRLSEEGQRQARVLASTFSRLGVQKIFSSPVARAADTASEVARAVGRDVEVSPLLDEIDFGEWTGCEFDALSRLEAWRTFNDAPAYAEIPGGESLYAVGERGRRALTQLVDGHAPANVVFVTHGDVIRLTLTQILAMPMSQFRRMEIDCGSISWLRLQPAAAPALVALNLRADGRAGWQEVT